MKLNWSLTLLLVLVALAASTFVRISNLRVSTLSKSYTLSSEPLSDETLAHVARLAAPMDAYVGLVSSVKDQTIKACLPSDKFECVRITFARNINQPGVVVIDCTAFSTHGRSSKLASDGMRMAEENLAKATL